MAAPTGSELQIGWKRSTRVDSYGQDIWTGPVDNFFRAKSASGLVAKRTLATTENMDPSNQTLKGDQVQSVISPKFSGNTDVNSIVKLLVHQAGKDATISTPAGGTTSRQWVITPYEAGDSAPASYLDSLIIEGSDGDGYPILTHGNRLQDVDVKITNNKLEDLDLTFFGCTDSYASDANQLAVGTYTGKPIIRGHWATANHGATLKVKCTATGTNGTVKWTIGAYAGSTTQAILFDTWYRITLDDGARLGVSRKQDVWFCFPSSGGTALAANDEWSFTMPRTLATASYSTRDPLQAAGLEFTVGGTVYYVRSAEIKMSRPRKANFVAGTQYALSVQKNGLWSATISLDRDREDREFLKKIITAESFAVAVKMYGNNIEVNIDELWQIDFANCQVSEDQRDVTTANTLPEKVEIRAHRSGSTDILQHTVICTQTAL